MPGTTINGGANAQANTPSGTAPVTGNPNASFMNVSALATPTIPSTISSSNLTSSAPIQVTQPAPTPVNTSALTSVTTPPLTETAGQQQESSLSSQLEALTTQDAGKAAYTTQQETAAGLPALQQSQADLQGQLKSLQDAAKALPLQYQNDATNPQGQGVFNAAAQNSSDQRSNAIQALNISAQVDATNGLISSANLKVTQAVNQQFAPIEAQITALQANLKTIANDPQTTIDEKNQIAQQLDAVNAQKDEIAQQKADQTTIQTTATTAAANIANFTPSAQYPTAAVAIAAISHAPDPATALQIATTAGLTEKASTTTATPKIIGSASSGYYEVDPKTGALTPMTPGTAGKPTATATENAAIGTSLSDAKAAIAQGADPTAVKQMFLSQHPTAAAKWTAFFTNTTQTGTTGAGEQNTYTTPAPAPATSGFNLFNPSTW